MDIKPRNGKLIWNAEPGECLFEGAFAADLAAHSNELPHFLKKIGEAGDDRSFALMSALVVEHHVNRLLPLLLPRFEQTCDDKAFTLAVRLAILESSNLLPRLILRSSNVIRDVRNAFAHKLESDSFDLLENKYRNRITTAFVNVFGKTKGENLKKQFRQIAFHAIAGLQLYYPSMKLYSLTIRRPEFLSVVQRAGKVDWDKQVDEASARSVKKPAP